VGPCIGRTAFAGATTGQQLLYALDEQVRRYESEGKVKKYEHWSFSSSVLDWQSHVPWYLRDGFCAPWKFETFAADAIIVATGGIVAIFGKSTNSVVCTGSAQSAALSARVLLRQRRVHPGPPDLHSRRRQTPPDVRVGARRRRARVGSEGRGR